MKGFVFRVALERAAAAARRRHRGTTNGRVLLLEVVERFNRLKQYRRVATRYEKTATNFLGFVLLSASLVWLA